MVQLKLYSDIFSSFMRAGLMTFGGGPSTIPLIQAEVVTLRGWMTVEEFVDTIALSNILPGPIATKLSAAIGYRMGGWLGAVAGVLGTVLPTAIAVIILIGLYKQYRNEAWAKGMMLAVRPVVVVLVAQTVLTMSNAAFPNGLSWLIAGIAAILLLVVKLNPALLITLAIAFGVVFLKP